MIDWAVVIGLVVGLSISLASLIATRGYSASFGFLERRKERKKGYSYPCRHNLLLWIIMMAICPILIIPFWILAFDKDHCFYLLSKKRPLF